MVLGPSPLLRGVEQPQRGNRTKPFAPHWSSWLDTMTKPALAPAHHHEYDAEYDEPDWVNIVVPTSAAPTTRGATAAPATAGATSAPTTTSLGSGIFDEHK
ncbi:hypothetical protein CYMTET_13262 [Cymbomonas tetramitiformis]|uniref:Uncharacterized protein n=1 Tax=Cymbomonas tetramitiformis TaxID=36881 RepID=A0AAE0LBD1_9CHLO|nr:hypothetical protein CYMTET_13262 [Cymbomonas tetramitiformis]